MSIRNELKIFRLCQKTGRMEEYKEYQTQKRNSKNEIIRLEKSFQEAKENFENISHSFSRDSVEYRNAEKNMQRWRYTLDEEKMTIDFIRPNSKEDIAYRDNIGPEYYEKLKAASKNLDLRFHGTPIYFAKNIIENGSVSSSADRYDGYVKSTDLTGEISVSTVETLSRTVDFFTDMAAYRRCLPAGCVFAFFPNNTEDVELTKFSAMKSVDFKQNPERLFGIFTTPENIEQVKGWMKSAELNPDIVYTFEGFIQAAEKKSAEIDKGKEGSTFLKVEDINVADVANTLTNPSRSFFNKKGKEDDDGR